MPPARLAASWIERARRWLRGRRARCAGPVCPPDPAQLKSPYPDYVTCPGCGEPEVEVWSDRKSARCHNCGLTFDYPPPG